MPGAAYTGKKLPKGRTPAADLETLTGKKVRPPEKVMPAALCHRLSSHKAQAQAGGSEVHLSTSLTALLPLETRLRSIFMYL